MQLPFATPMTTQRADLPRAALPAVLCAVAVLGALTFVQRLRIGLGADVFGFDFREDYLSARGWWDGFDLYRLSVDALSLHYLGVRNAPYPNPHLPSAVALMLPLAGLDVGLAQSLWLAGELLCLLVATVVGARVLGLGRPLLVGGLLAIGLMAWQPVEYELTMGQVQLPILAALVCAYAALLRRRDVLAGGLLGVTLLLKPLVWPILLALAVHRRWRAPAAAGAVAAVGYVASAALLGWTHAVGWLTYALPATTAVTSGEAWNMSLWTLGRRLVVGTGPGIADYLTAPPLVHAPALAQPLSLLAVGAVLLFALRPGRALGAAYGVAVCAAVLVSPMVWDYYLLLALLPAGLLVRDLAGRGWPHAETRAMLVALALLALPRPTWEALARAAAGISPNGDPAVIPLWLLPMTVAPIFGVAVLMWAVSRCRC
jgi:hypothetical protein